MSLNGSSGFRVSVATELSPAFPHPASHDSGGLPHTFPNGGTAAKSETRTLVDSHGRVLRDLRISLTDRCNFRCLYCLPETEAAQNFYRGHWAHMPNSTPIVQQWVPKSNLLSFEEIERVVRLAASLGIQKLRLTGGEPLLRHDVEKLVARLAQIPGIIDLAMTTNGFLFPDKARALRDAGLQRVSFSLDSLDQANFKKLTGRDGLEQVLKSISLAQELGFNPVKVNAVVIRGLNDHEIGPLAEFARERNLSLRFIEFMPLDSARAWLKEMVVPGHEVLARAQQLFDLRPAPTDNPSATAKRWVFADGRGELGIIAPVTEPFCGHCNRIRLTADGKVRTCLFSVTEHDLRSLLRNGASDDKLSDWLKAVVWQKEARHHIGEPDFVPPSRSMSCIGG
jgi:cyclic pyranopterin phosphate synthase